MQPEQPGRLFSAPVFLWTYQARRGFFVTTPHCIIVHAVYAQESDKRNG